MDQRRYWPHAFGFSEPSLLVGDFFSDEGTTNGAKTQGEKIK